MHWKQVKHEAQDTPHLSTELLLELPHESGVDLVVGLEQPVGHVDDDGLAVARDVNFLGVVDVQVLQVALQLLVRGLQIEQGLGMTGEYW